MATMATSGVCSASVAAAAAAASSSGCSSSRSRSSSSNRSSSSRRSTMSSFGGLKASNEITALGTSQGVDEQFAKMRLRCMASSRRASAPGGGALACKASVADEIFRVVPIMSALVLIGIAGGFLLLRVEQAVEEAEE